MRNPIRGRPAKAPKALHRPSLDRRGAALNGSLLASCCRLLLRGSQPGDKLFEYEPCPRWRRALSLESQIGLQQQPVELACPLPSQTAELIFGLAQDERDGLGAGPHGGTA